MAPKKTLHQLTREMPSGKEIDQLFKLSIRGNDRVWALLGSAHLQNALCASIIERLPRSDDDEAVERLYDNGAPLSSFFSIIQLGYVLGLFDSQARADLNRIRNIRNTFAYALRTITFETPEIARECQKLQWRPALSDKEHRTLAARLKSTTNRTAFTLTVLGYWKIFMEQYMKRSDKKIASLERQIKRADEKIAKSEGSRKSV